MDLSLGGEVEVAGMGEVTVCEVGVGVDGEVVRDEGMRVGGHPMLGCEGGGGLIGVTNILMLPLPSVIIIIFPKFLTWFVEKSNHIILCYLILFTFS